MGQVKNVYRVLIGNPEDKIRNCLHDESVDVRVILT
jgi:hypothetical protein